MATNTGIGTTLSVGTESTYGTEVARTRTVDLKSTTIQATPDNAPIESLGAYSNAAVAAVQTAITAGGDTVCNVAYAKSMLGLLLYHALGTVAESGAGPYDHTFTPAVTVPSASIELVRGTSGGESEEGYGFQISKLVLVLEAGKPAELTLSWIGKSTGARAAPGTIPTNGTNRLFILGHHCPGIVWGGTTSGTRKITLTIDNKLEGKQDLGSLYIAEAIRSARMEVTVEVELIKRASAMYADALACTARALSFRATSGTSYLDFAAPTAIVETQSDPINSAGAVMERVRFRCLGDEVTPAPVCTIVLRNGDATYGAS